MVSSTRALAADLLSHMGCEEGPPWIELVPKHIQSYRDLGHLEAGATP